MQWKYTDNTGVERVGTVERTSDHGGSDVTYFFRREDGKLDVLQGSYVKATSAAPIYPTILVMQSTEGSEMQNTHLTETSEELLDHLARSTGYQTTAYHTGGGCMVACIDLSIDARGLGRQAWLTRDGDETWLLGFYDFATDAEDEGVCVTLFTPGDKADNPGWIASQVAGIFDRLGVSLQGA